MKNWLPPALGQPVLAIARIPRPYLGPGNAQVTVAGRAVGRFGSGAAAEGIAAGVCAPAVGAAASGVAGAGEGPVPRVANRTTPTTTTTTATTEPITVS